MRQTNNFNFSFQFIVSYVWYSTENLAGDLLLGLKFAKLPILPTLFIHFVQGRLRELRSGYLGLKGPKQMYGSPLHGWQTLHFIQTFMPISDQDIHTLYTCNTANFLTRICICAASILWLFTSPRSTEFTMSLCRGN